MAVAAYASLVSLMTVIDQIQNHPSPPITLHKEQVESLCNNINFLQDFLEVYSHGVIDEVADGLENRILEAAYAAEDMIESHLVDKILGESTSCADDAAEDLIESGVSNQILSESTCHARKKIRMMDNLYLGLQKVACSFDFLKQEVMHIKERMTAIQDCAQIIPVGSVRYLSKGHKTYMVGFDDVQIEVLDKLTARQPSRQIMTIVGMGGIGKTTLARNIYENQLIVRHFDICCWVSISQDYKVREIFLEALSNWKNKTSGEDLTRKSEQELGETLYRRLWDRRYLIIMDDMWSTEVWDKIKCFFPDNNNGSRIMITTRMSNMTSLVTHSHNITLNFLDESQSWELLCKNVFGEDACPNELKEVGKNIARNCKGLPLSIAVISGLLKKSTRTREHWEIIAKNLNFILNLEEDKQCIKILYMSYSHLPIHLKACFLYTGVFPEDSEIRASILIKLWLAEGFLKSIDGKSLEVVAEEYIKDLVDWNLICVKSMRLNGKIKSFYIHDLLRDICLREAEKENFLWFSQTHKSGVQHGMKAQRCVIHGGTHLEGKCLSEAIVSFPSAPFTRSLIGNNMHMSKLPLPFKLLRVLRTACQDLIQNTSSAISFKLVNLRFISVYQLLPWSFNNIGDLSCFTPTKLPPWIHLSWNLQTLIICDAKIEDVTNQIWRMHRLRHIKVGKLLLLEPPGQEFGLWNLQSMSCTFNLRLSDEVVIAIPNLRRLKCLYTEYRPNYCINNFIHLQKLESLALHIRDRTNRYGSRLNLNLPLCFEILHQNFNLPHSLKKLSLEGTNLCWKDVTKKLGLLPHLEVLKLYGYAVEGSEWRLTKGKFCSLRFLEIHHCRTWRCWVAKSIHFPSLEHIILQDLYKLRKIPLGVGEIPTLQSIKLKDCSDSVVASAKKILKKQEELGNFDLKIETEDI